MNRLSQSTKLGYGMGGIAVGVKDAAFNMFLMFYYTQVLGLKGSVAGIALLIGLIIDAVTDPIMGSISDNFSSKHGRRHPFMLISAVPLALSLFGLFSPINGLGQTGLFIWLTTFVVAVRVSLTIYLVPYLALGAEMTSDYVERTKLSAYRTTILWLGGVATASLSLGTLFKKTATHAIGQMNAAAYPIFGVVIGVVCVLAILACVYLTRNEIPKLPKSPPNPKPFRFKRLWHEVTLALRNPSFRVVAAASIFSGIIVGTHTNLNMHVNTYFWEFTSKNLAVISTAIFFSCFAAFIIMRRLERYDKRKVFIGTCFFSVFHNLLIVLRLLGLLPENGDPLLIKLAYLQVLYTTTLAIVQSILIGSIIADTVDEGELITNVRQEGIYFSFISFTTKGVSGFGALFAGFIIDAIGLPAKAVPGTVDPAVVFKLGLIIGPIIGTLWIIPLFIILSRKMTKERQQEIRELIRRRKKKETIPMDSLKAA